MPPTTMVLGPSAVSAQEGEWRSRPISNSASSPASANTLFPQEEGMLIHLLSSNNQVEIRSELDAHWPSIHPNCYAPAALTAVHLLAGGGSGTAVFEGQHPVAGSIVMKHGGPKDLQEVFSLSLISKQLQERGSVNDHGAKAAAAMKKRIPEFVMLYLSPFHLRDRSRERWSRPMRRSDEHLMQKESNEDEESDSDDSDMDGTNKSAVDAKKYIPRRIRLEEGVDDAEVALEVYFNFVSLEVPACRAQNCWTIQKGHSFLAALLEELVPAQQDQNWKFTVAQKTIGGPTAQNGAAVLTSGKLSGELLERLVQDFIYIIRDLRKVTLPEEVVGVESVRTELQELRLSKDLSSISKSANAFVGSAIKKNFEAGGRFHLLRDIGERFRRNSLVLTENEEIPASFLGTLLEPQADLALVFVKSPAPKSALDYILQDGDYWLNLLDDASSFEHPSATDRIWTCGLTDAGLHNLFLSSERGVELFDLGEPQLSPQPAFLTKFFMSFFHAFGMEETKDGTSWVRRFYVDDDRHMLDLTLETKEMMPYCYEAFNHVMDEFVDELFEGDESVRDLQVKYVVLQLLSDAAFCLARWEEKGGGKKRLRKEAQEGLEKWLWRSLWDIFIACDVHQKLLIDGTDSLLQGFSQSFALRNSVAGLDVSEYR